MTARSEAGKPRRRRSFPSWRGWNSTFGEQVERAELVFVALPDDAAVESVPDLLAQGRRVVDLSAGFRLRDAGPTPPGTATSIPRPRCSKRRSMGWRNGRAPNCPTRLVACPGCYPTAALLPLLPLRWRS